MYEGSLCVCCMSTEDLVELFVTKTVNIVEENYAKLLAACLGIQLSETMGHDFICAVCISKLKQCVAFKKQIFKSICLLSPFDITILFSDEDISVLGLAELKEKVLEIDINTNDSEPKIDLNEELNDCSSIHEKLNDCASIHEKLNDCSSIYEGIEELDSDFEEKRTLSPPPSPVKIDKLERDKTKRPVGRPRKRPKDTLPYHLEKDELKCRECGEEFPCNFSLKVHYNSHFPNHACRKCGKTFVTYSSLRRHDTSHLQGPFQCHVCGQEFRNINTLRSHVRHKHRASEAYRCAECGVRFPTQHRRERHLAETHASTRRYPCPHCRTVYATAAARWKHIAYKHNVKLFPCPVCGVRYRKQKLRGHIRTHTNTDTTTANKKKRCKDKDGSTGEDRRFICRLCNKAFSQKVTLKYHIGMHVRKGQYRGEPDYLIVDRRLGGCNDTGMLPEDNLEVEESLLSDDLVQDDKIDNVDTLQVDCCVNVDEDDPAEIVDTADMESNGYEIFTDIGFMSSDYD